MTIIDVSVGLDPSLPVWPGHPKIGVNRIEDIDKGANANVSFLEFSAHAGTHVDAPLHFLQDGSDISAMDLEMLIGPAFLIDVVNAKIIDDNLLGSMSIPQGTQRLLIKTTNSSLWSRKDSSFQKDFVAIDNAGARWIVDQGIRLIGVDYLSVAPYGNTGPTHRTLLSSGVIPVEGLNFDGVNAGVYDLICLPIKIEGCEGSPARVVLIDNNK